MIETRRLTLRRWRDDDLAPFAAINADPVVMEHFPSPMTEADTADFISRCEASFEDEGLGMWAVELASGKKLIGICGLFRRTFDAPFAPAVDVGWRFAKEQWGNGYATEAALGSLEFGFSEVGLDEIVSFTVPQNVRSRRVMERIGMTYDSTADFDHPDVSDERLRRHLLYRISASRFAEIIG